MTIYFLIGLWTWICISTARYKTFKGASKLSILTGFIFGVLFWPITPIVVWINTND